VEFVPNWHIDTICDHLEAVSRGDITKLLINIPPGCMKSSLVSELWPAWEWATDGGVRVFTASFSSYLSVRDSLRVRDIVTTPWYRAHFQLGLRQDQNQKVGSTPRRAAGGSPRPLALAGRRASGSSWVWDWGSS